MMLPNTIEEGWSFETGSITESVIPTICWNHEITIYTSL